MEEILRYESPVQNLARVVLEDFELAGQVIKAGDKVVPFLNAANRDAKVFPEPDNFDIERQHNRHLAFGFGKHLCVGAHLARLEARLTFNAFVKYLSQTNQNYEAEAKWAKVVAFRQMESLIIRPLKCCHTGK